MSAARVIQVIQTHSVRGEGKDENDPVRLVQEFWTLDGKLLAENDPCLHRLGNRQFFEFVPDRTA